MRTVRRAGAICVGLALALTAAACNTESSGDSAEPPAQQKQLTIGLANQQESVTFPAAISEGAKKKAAELGVKLVTLDSQGDQAKQASQVQDLIAQKVDGIILVPLSPGPAQALVDQADAAGIAVGTAHGYVGADRKPEDPYSKLKFIVTEDEVGSGATAGEMAVKAVPNGGKVAVITGAAGFQENTTRVSDFTKALETKGGFTVVATQPGNWTKQDGQAACQNILAANQDVALFYAISDDMAVGCGAAIKAANSTAKVIGIGGAQVGIDAIKDGTMYGTVCYKPFDEGGQAVQQMYDALTGKLTGAPKTNFYETPGVTKDNVDSCVPQW
ncbi:ribose transport system substrate-binding protein [Asanoa hainanensis]|uniref:Ribose transport system substrate-binding protein n=1 Tax=Asanoa hainanensis TaxID=560556 RepID=A0A239N8B4_9ACTN|nr:sugar ABC transporter substrate-binding protein [Asanoa hainanensis]SNT50448.1 ribose transport system substrate-binding protein [Asanoa hainanensis]